jgi:hypothetical protein
MYPGRPALATGPGNSQTGAQVEQQAEYTTNAEQALRALMAKVKPEQWIKINQALEIIASHGGHGTIEIVVRDGYICGHPGVKIAL